jgi:hypothetical protein
MTPESENFVGMPRWRIAATWHETACPCWMLGASLHACGCHPGCCMTPSTLVGSTRSVASEVWLRVCEGDVRKKQNGNPACWVPGFCAATTSDCAKRMTNAAIAFLVENSSMPLLYLHLSVSG